MGSVELDNVSKVFSGPEGDIAAVEDVTMTIQDGEFVVLVGPSGSGKSTLLRLVAGLESITDGEIRLDGESLTGVKPKNRDVAMVFQNYALYPHLTARKNMSFGLKMQGDLPKDDIDSQVEKAARIMGITDLLEKMPNELSGGQKQRVALGRAIVREPAVFLMDEPLSNLDAKLRTTMRTEIQELQQELGVTTIYVTHDQTEAMTMGDRIAIMNDGAVQQVGRPMDTYHRPANQFVAGFIGSPSMNFIPCEAAWGTDALTLTHPAFELTFSETLDTIDRREETDVILGIRPEDARLARGSDGGDTVDVEIEVVEPLGKEQLFYYELDGERYTASVSGHQQLSVGSTVTLQFPEANSYLFDAETGETIKHQTVPEEAEPTSEMYQ
ncbi:ABC transporter ATP-binding protein [Halomicroarcula sp. GCM10025709]|uniref:ABC transporter ATP-binding protein n=1 Tax=Haloarcula TaxID=2237 RepID=UPI0024C213E7|nr:sn-glycerol-3-phosphate ABC transporter ATP-binding protein UgpC [Halomicroarcula sp. YJ-61-S]